MKELAYISLGSNLGNRKKNLELAIARMMHLSEGDINRSQQYETDPWNMDSGNAFINQVVSFHPALNPEDLLNSLQQIENDMGRASERQKRNGYADRTIDLDIIYYGDVVMKKQHLVVPHPRLSERMFVLEPLCEIAPSFIHPILRISNQSLLDKLKDTNHTK